MGSLDGSWSKVEEEEAQRGTEQGTGLGADFKRLGTAPGVI